ncbi:MAG: hypothetical protein M1819_001550 [Sarea resinae]|nr:MAG: hypothetical protein M1819_001550 [Sarea resinae]
MSSATNPVILPAAGLLAVAAVFVALRAEYSQVFSFFDAPGGYWKLAALVLALLNVKNLPFVWHIRIFNALVYQLYLRPADPTPAMLFLPLITSSRTPALECDYNLHKSNSTYFSDLDVSRTHVVATLFRKGFAALAAEEKGGWLGGKFAIMLGGIHCSFRREIKPYEKFEIWTRVLCWDRKWIYFVSHVVRAGTVVPKGYSLQSASNRSWYDALFAGRKSVRKQKTNNKSPAVGSNGHATSQVNGTAASEQGPQPHPAILASSIAKYVLKKGRMTIPPEKLISAAGLLPENYISTSIADFASSNGKATGGAIPELSAEQSLDGVLIPDRVSEQTGVDTDIAWTPERVEEERQRGLQVAAAFGGLDSGLYDAFTAEEKPALGVFRDLFS